MRVTWQPLARGIALFEPTVVTVNQFASDFICAGESVGGLLTRLADQPINPLEEPLPWSLKGPSEMD